MIILDIETSGMDPLKHGIVELAAIKFENPVEYFHNFCRLDEDDEINPKSLEINGQTAEQVRDSKRISQKDMLNNFFIWMTKIKDFYAAGENVGRFDCNFIDIRGGKYGLKCPLQHRSFDLNTAILTKYQQVYAKLPIVDGKNEMGLPQILEFVGLKDERGKHGALEDARLEAECFSRLLYGKSLLKEFEKFPVPNYLTK